MVSLVSGQKVTGVFNLVGKHIVLDQCTCPTA